MKTRSQNKELEVNIDFDEASRAWLQNKRRLASGTYNYICGVELKDGSFCQRNPTKFSEYCHFHKSMSTKDE
jgi:hypothetical protein